MRDAAQRTVDFLTADELPLLHLKNRPRVALLLQCGVSAVRRRIFWSKGMSINKDQIEGRAKEASGKVQEVAGKTLGNVHQQMKGNINKNVGAAQAKFGDAKSNIKDSKQGR
jgi:uncharacterized protein YjbJ (UPF0337 family)